MEAKVDDKQHINKKPTSSAEGEDERAFDIAGNVKRRGEDPSPDDRERGERSDAGPADAEETGRR
jgi:hypothetical protein